MQKEQLTFEDAPGATPQPKRKAVKAKKSTPIFTGEITWKIITPKELADILEVSSRVIQKRILKGTIRGIKEKQAWKIPITEIDRLKAERS